jgi:hypothetical protein
MSCVSSCGCREETTTWMCQLVIGAPLRTGRSSSPHGGFVGPVAGLGLIALGACLSEFSRYPPGGLVGSWAPGLAFCSHSNAIRPALAAGRAY